MTERDRKLKELSIIYERKKIDKFENKIQNDLKYRKKFVDELDAVKKELNAKPEEGEPLINPSTTLNDIMIAWHGKKLGRYKNLQDKKLAQLTEKIINRDFKDDPKYKTWIDQQTKGQREKIERLQKTYKKLKEISDRRETGVSDEEAQNIMNLYDRLSKTKSDMENGRDRMVYGRAWVDFTDYVNDLKLRAVKPTFKEALLSPVKTGTKLAGMSKAVRHHLIIVIYFGRDLRPCGIIQEYG